MLFGLNLRPAIRSHIGHCKPVFTTRSFCVSSSYLIHKELPHNSVEIKVDENNLFEDSSEFSAKLFNSLQSFRQAEKSAVFLKIGYLSLK